MTAEAGAQAARPRARELGLKLGRLTPGPHNAITDVKGVRVGHCTIVRGDGPLVAGEGPVRTGVTAVVPHGGNVFAEKVTAAVHVMNGFGKPIGFVQIDECGVLETPILLTNTLSVGAAADGLVDYMLQHNPAVGVTTGTVNPVVAECNDGYLNDIRGRHVGRKHVRAALANAERGSVEESADGDGAVEEGAVGAGTGMSAFGWKAGIGTSSRLVSDYVVGALVLSNFGDAADLVVGGWPVGSYLAPPPSAPHSGTEEGDGSVVIVLATDAPLSARQLRRVAARAVVGIVRCGSRLAHGSGDYAIAFSTTNRVPHTFAAQELSKLVSAPSPTVPDDHPVMADLLRAAGEATEEAVLNSLLRARTTVGRDGHVRHELPVDRLQDLIRRFSYSVEC